MAGTDPVESATTRVDSADRAPLASVLVVEPHEVARRGLMAMMASLPQVSRAESCASCRSAVGMLSDDAPDVMFLASDTSGDEIDELMSARRLGARIVVLVRSSEPAHLSQALRLQADGYLMESDLSLATLSSALDQVLLGQMSLPTGMASHLLADARTRDSRSTQRFPLLTQRERQVLVLLVEGYSNKQIARQLSISIHGAKRHVANVLMKLNCPNRTHAVARALTEGWIDESTSVDTAATIRV